MSTFTVHLTDDLVLRYRQRTLSPDELLRLETHLADCETCRSLVARPAAWYAAHTKLVETEWSLHLSQEELVDFLLGNLRAAEHAVSRAHLDDCRMCGEDLARLEAFQQAEAEAVQAQRAPARAAAGAQKWSSPPHAGQLAVLFSRPMIWLPSVAAALAGLVVFAVMQWQMQPLRNELRAAHAREQLLAHERARLAERNQQIETGAARLPLLEQQNSALRARQTALAADIEKERQRARSLEARVARSGAPPPQIALNDGGAEIVRLPDGTVARVLRETLPRMVSAAIGIGRLEGPPELLDLGGEAPQGKGGAARFPLRAPVGTVVLERTPTFRWARVKGAAGYRLTLWDETGRIAARSSGLLSQARWVSPDPLLRGHRYRWEVQALDNHGQVVGQAPQRPDPAARFQVLAENKLSELQEVLEKYSTSHLLKALHYVHAGLLDNADREIDALAKLNPKSSIPHTLHSQIHALRSAGRGLK